MKALKHTTINLSAIPSALSYQQNALTILQLASIQPVQMSCHTRRMDVGYLESPKVLRLTKGMLQWVAAHAQGKNEQKETRWRYQSTKNGMHTKNNWKQEDVLGSRGVLTHLD